MRIRRRRLERARRIGEVRASMGVDGEEVEEVG